MKFLRLCLHSERENFMGDTFSRRRSQKCEKSHPHNSLLSTEFQLRRWRRMNGIFSTHWFSDLTHIFNFANMFEMGSAEKLKTRKISIAWDDKDSIKWYHDKRLLKNGVKIVCIMWLHVFTQHYASCSFQIHYFMTFRPPYHKRKCRKPKKRLLEPTKRLSWFINSLINLIHFAKAAKASTQFHAHPQI